VYEKNKKERRRKVLADVGGIYTHEGFCLVMLQISKAWEIPRLSTPFSNPTSSTSQEKPLRHAEFWKGQDMSWYHHMTMTGLDYVVLSWTVSKR
jgi:hypothetical protein